MSGHRARKTREVVVLAAFEALLEVIDVVDEELLRALDVVGEFPDDVAVHHVLEADRADAALQRGREPDPVRDGQLLVLRGARRRDRVQHEGHLAGEERTVVRRRVPRHHLGRHRLLVERLDELDRVARVRRIEHDVFVLVLYRAAERIQDRAHRHRRVELGRQADADGDLMLALDFLADTQHVVPARGPMRHALLGPQIDPVIHRIGNEAVGEAEVLLRPRVVGALDREVDRLAVLLRTLVVDLLVVDHLRLVTRCRPQEHEEIVTLLGRHLGGRARIDRWNPDVIDDHLRVVLLAPLPGICVVEPFVVGGHEVAPLENLQRVARRACRTRDDVRSHARRKSDGTRGLHESAARHVASIFLSHGIPPSLDR